MTEEQKRERAELDAYYFSLPHKEQKHIDLCTIDKDDHYRYGFIIGYKGVYDKWSIKRKLQSFFSSDTIFFVGTILWGVAIGINIAMFLMLIFGGD